jgi:hypothetical protein
MLHNPAAALDYYEQAIQNKSDAGDYALLPEGVDPGYPGEDG